MREILRLTASGADRERSCWRVNPALVRWDGSLFRRLAMSDDYHRKRHLEWREKVLRRAKYLCEECARYGRRTPATVAHHIKHADEYPELRYVLSNGRALCSACHNKYHPEKVKKANESR